MKNLIKTDLYYFFSNKIITVVYAAIAIYSAIMPWVCNSVKATLDAAKYISCLGSNDTPDFYVRIDHLIVVVTVLMGIMLNGIFKNGMIVHQEVAVRSRALPMLAMAAASCVAVFLFMLPFITVSIILYITNGAYNCDGNAVPLSLILLVMLMLMINIIHVEINAIILSDTLRSEIKGFGMALGIEIIKFFFGWNIFSGLEGNAVWIPYGLFPLISMEEISSRIYWTRTNVPFGFLIGLPFVGLIMDAVLLVVIMLAVRRAHLSRQ